MNKVIVTSPLDYGKLVAIFAVIYCHFLSSNRMNYSTPTFFL